MEEKKVQFFIHNVCVCTFLYLSIEWSSSWLYNYSTFIIIGFWIEILYNNWFLREYNRNLIWNDQLIRHFYCYTQISKYTQMIAHIFFRTEWKINRSAYWNAIWKSQWRWNTKIETAFHVLKYVMNIEIVLLI